MGSFFQLRRLVSSELGSDRLALEVARGFRTTSPQRWIWRCGAWRSRFGARPIPAPRAHFAAADPADLAAEYLAGTLPPVVQTALAGFLARYGFRGLAEIDLGRPRWRENPAQIMQTVQNYTQITDPDQAPDAVFRHGTAAAEPPSPQSSGRSGIPIKRRLARFFASRDPRVGGLPRVPEVHADPHHEHGSREHAHERPGTGRSGRLGSCR